MLKRLYYNKLRKKRILIFNSFFHKLKISKDFFYVSRAYSLFFYPQIFVSMNSLKLSEFFNSKFTDYYVTKYNYNFFLKKNKKFFLINDKNFYKFLYIFNLFEQNFLLKLNKKKKLTPFVCKLNFNILSYFFIKKLKSFIINSNSEKSLNEVLSFFYIKLFFNFFFYKIFLSYLVIKNVYLTSKLI